MLALIPLLGPVIQGVISPIIGLFGKYFDDKTQVTLSETQASTQIIQAEKDDWGVRLARDIVMWPWCLWLGGYGWDTFVALHWPWLKIGIADVPTEVAFIPYAVMIFLFGNIGLNMWNKHRG